MEQDTKYIPHSAKATEFNIPPSSGAKENDERVSFLKQQVQQAKEAYETTLKTVVEECISLEIAAAKKEETDHHGPPTIHWLCNPNPPGHQM